MGAAESKRRVDERAFVLLTKLKNEARDKKSYCFSPLGGLRKERVDELAPFIDCANVVLRLEHELLAVLGLHQKTIFR